MFIVFRGEADFIEEVIVDSVLYFRGNCFQAAFFGEHSNFTCVDADDEFAVKLFLHI